MSKKIDTFGVILPGSSMEVNSPTPTGNLQIFIGRRPDNPESADKSKMILDFPVRWAQ